MTESTQDRMLDAALERWAVEPAGDQAAIARIVRHGDALARSAPRRSWRLALAGTAVAASVGLLMLVTGPRPASDPSPASEGIASFMLLHTPTPYEEPLI